MSERQGVSSLLIDSGRGGESESECWVGVCLSLMYSRQKGVSVFDWKQLGGACLLIYSSQKGVSIRGVCECQHPPYAGSDSTGESTGIHCTVAACCWRYFTGSGGSRIFNMGGIRSGQRSRQGDNVSEVCENPLNVNHIIIYHSGSANAGNMVQGIKLVLLF